MRIGLYGRVLLKPGSGIVNYSYELIENLLKYDNKNEYILYVMKNRLPRKKFDERLEIRQTNLPYFMWRTMLFTKQVEKDDIDVYHSTAYSLPLVPKRLRGFSVVSTFHGLHPKIFWQSFKDNVYLGLDYRSASIFADRIMAVSNALKQEIFKIYKKPLDKIDVVYFGLSEQFKPQSIYGKKQELIFKRYHIQMQQFILSVSGKTKNKNVNTILQSWSILKHRYKFNIPLVILRATIDDQMLTRLGLIRGKDVIPIDWVDDMPLLYSSAAFSVYHSTYEGVGFPIIESMACGSPVITSNVPPMAEAAGGNAILVNNPKDPEEWASKIIELYEDENLQNKLRKKGLKWAKNFTWDKIIKRVIGSYKRASEE